MVGCLGGLGRSLTAWMRERGCKNFAFVSRSGTDKPEAADVVEMIEKAGASTQVFRADATNGQDVAKIVATIGASRIRGVIYAAMVLQVSLSNWYGNVLLKAISGWFVRENYL